MAFERKLLLLAFNHYSTKYKQTRFFIGMSFSIFEHVLSRVLNVIEIMIQLLSFFSNNFTLIRFVEKIGDKI